MSDLIVDFPSHRSLTSKKTVQFSNTCQVQVFKRADEDATSTMWHSQKDYKAMRLATVQAVQQARRALSSNNSDLMQEDESDIDIVLTGIENILTPSAIKRTKAQRSQHWNAVLTEQKRQCAAGVQQPEVLAYVSNHFSKSSVRRAHTIGLLQSR